MFDPLVYDRSIKKLDVAISTQWFQVKFKLPDEIKERLPKKYWGEINRGKTIELPTGTVAAGHTIVYPPPLKYRSNCPQWMDGQCPSFRWKITDILLYARTYKSREPRVVAEIEVNFGGSIDE